jgi:hypothetical protein
MNYLINNEFQYTSGFSINADNVIKAVYETNGAIIKNPANLYKTVDLKTTSSILGAIYCGCLAHNITGAIVNPIEKWHPDIIPESGRNSTETELRNYPYGIEIKATVGNVKTGVSLKHRQNRLQFLTGITWQAHHREMRELMGLIWDFDNLVKDFTFPITTGVFFSPNLILDEWGTISGTTGRNTKVCGMTSTGRVKMKEGWIVIHKKYIEKYNQLL